VNLLVDDFGRKHTYLRVSVTDRCNLRCLYCTPTRPHPLRPPEELLALEEIARVARIFASLGITKIRLTGGEPLLRPRIESLVQDLAATRGLDTVALTTNGLLLARHARALKAAGLSQLNVSLDTLRPERFARIALRDAQRAVWKGIEAALEAGLAPLKINVVVLEGINDDEILDFVELARDRPFSVRFIEYMRFSCNRRRDARLVPYAAMRRRIEERYRLEPVAVPRAGAPVAREFRIEGFAGTIGFISPVSSRFCAGCNRLRLMADGSLKTCLFVSPAASVRGALRGGAPDAEIERLIVEAVRTKRAPSPSYCPACEHSMVEIGG
jgi:cyclic pyranopterin phosphate synthase